MRVPIVIGIALFLCVKAGSAVEPADKEPTAEERKALKEKIDRLVHQLGDEAFPKRQQAWKELEAIGEPAIDTLKKASESAEDAEIRDAAGRLLHAIMIKIVEVEIAKGLMMNFCWVPAGEAQLGSPKEEQDYLVRAFYDGKRPDWMDREKEDARGKFKTKGFWLGRYAVTQEQWAAVMGENPSWLSNTGGGKRNAAGMDTSRFPVEMVSWNDCQKFLAKVNETAKRPSSMGKGKFALPHEDQWEYACRGGKGNKQAFYFGNELNGRQANCNGNFPPYGTEIKGPWLGRTAEVGSYEEKSPHPWGLCDMCGNLWQWCENKYGDKNDRRVLRGGSWNNRPIYCRSAFREDNAPDIHYSIFGFRVVFLP